MTRHRHVPSLLSLLLLGGCAGGGASTHPPAGAPEDDLRRVVSVLAADSLRGRDTGTPEAEAAARFLADELRRIGVQPAYPAAPGRDSAYFQGVPLVRAASGRARVALLPAWEALDTVPAARRVRGVNVVGILRGADPALRDQAVVVGAHYDHIGVRDPVDGDSIYNGADDDASGVATVLEVARALARGPRPARTVVFLLTTAEEQAILGGRWYVRHPVVPLERTVADLQVEMVGRPDPEMGGPGRGWLTGYRRSTLGRTLAAAGIPIVDDPRPAQRFFERSDNLPFACRGIPAHTLSSFGMHADYHRPDDEVERIDFAHLARMAEAATRAVRLMVAGPPPTWEPGGDPSSELPSCRAFR